MVIGGSTAVGTKCPSGVRAGGGAYAESGWDPGGGLRWREVSGRGPQGHVMSRQWTAVQNRSGDQEASWAGIGDNRNPGEAEQGVWTSQASLDTPHPRAGLPL